MSGGAARMPRFFTRFRVRLLGTVLIIVMLSLSASYVLMYRFVIAWNQRANEQQTIDAFSKVETSIDWTLESALNFSLFIQTDQIFDQYVNESYLTGLEKTLLETELVSRFDRYMTAYPNINAVIFFRGDGQVGGSSYPRAYFFKNQSHPFYETEAYRRALDNPGKERWDTDHLRYYYSQSEPFQQEQHKDIMITNIRAISGAPGTPPTVLLVSIQEPTLGRFYDQLAEEDVGIVLLNEEGRLFSGMPIDAFGTVPDYYSLIDVDRQYGSFSYEGEEDSQIIYYRMASTGWIMVKTVPTRIYGQDMQVIGKRMLEISLITMVLIVVFILGSVVHFTKPVETLTSTMIMAGEGRLDIRAKTDSNIYEIRALSRAFNRMLGNIGTLFARVQQAEEDKMELEIRALQNQIKPHFIYNTIASIRWMATLSGANGVADALVMLIKLLRPVYDGPAVYWSLGEEIAFLQNYAALMRMRTGKDVSLIVEVDAAEMAIIRLPRFLLQPSVENCFEHAIQSRSHMKIVIELCRDADGVTISVKDDGAGMSREQMDRICGMLAGDIKDNEGDSRKGIGLYNCHRRLQLIYGAKSGLHIQNGEQGGLIVTYRMEVKSVNSAKAVRKV